METILNSDLSCIAIALYRDDLSVIQTWIYDLMNFSKNIKSIIKFPKIKWIILLEKIKKICLYGIKNDYLTILVCQLLNVKGIPFALDHYIKKNSNGNPGWINSYIKKILNENILKVS